jgi:YD repeat-containing protein
VQEFTGANPYTVYATTTYAYDLLGNLTDVYDGLYNQNPVLYAEDHTHIDYDMLGRKTGMDDMDMGVWSYDYDAAGNLWHQTDARGIVTTLEYDALGRLTSKTYSNGEPAVSFYYDSYDEEADCDPLLSPSNTAVGQTTKMVDSSGTTRWCYDLRGQVVKERKTIDGVDYDTTRTYDSAGRVGSLTYPDGEEVTQSYWDDGAQTHGLLSGMDSVTYGDRYFGPAVYTTDRLQLDTLELGTSPTTAVDYGYDNRGRVTNITSGTIQDLVYTYDGVGNVQTITDNTVQPAEATTFAYDELNRLTGASGGYSAAYEYSTNGRLLSKTEQYTDDFDYNDPDHPHAVTEAHSSSDLNHYSMAYDANGNLTRRASSSPSAVGGITEWPDVTAPAADGDSAPPLAVYIVVGGVAVIAATGVWRRRKRGTIVLLLVLAVPLLAEQATETHAAPATSTGAELYTYDAETRLTQRWDGVNRTTYTYDGQGNLVKKSSSDGTWTIYIGGIYEKHQDGSYVTYYNGLGRRLAMRVHAGPGDPGTMHFFLADHLGSTSMVLSAARVVEQSEKYYPYGGTRSSEGTAVTDKKFTGQQEKTGDAVRPVLLRRAVLQHGAGAIPLRGSSFAGLPPKTSPHPVFLLSERAEDTGPKQRDFSRGSRLTGELA